MTKFRILRREITLDCLSGPSVITKVLVKGKQEDMRERKGCDNRSRDRS